MAGRAQSLSFSFSADPGTQAALELPEAPEPAQPPAPKAPLPAARPLEKYIEPGQPTRPLTVGDKVLIGLRDTASPFSAAGWVLSSAYSQAIHGTPNYGRNGKAYAQRLGAAAARAASEDIFSDTVLASALHEDPRYYKLGPGFSGPRRTFHAITRVLVTRTDGGQPTVNFALLGGNLAGAALTQAYYPPHDRGLGETMKTYGLSLSGTAFRLLVAEFFDDAIDNTVDKVLRRKPAADSPAQ